jgi:hypothetical protein
MGQLDKPARGRNRRISERDRERFLELVRSGHTIRHSAEATGHPPRTFYALARRDPEFSVLYQEAKDIGTDVAEEEAWRRAVEGVIKPVWGKVAPGIDGQIGTEVEYSDRMLEVLLKGRRPEYREKQGVTIDQRSVNLTIEDRSAALEDVARVLAEAGVQLGIGNGGAGVIEGVSKPRGVLAESEEL